MTISSAKQESRHDYISQIDIHFFKDKSKTSGKYHIDIPYITCEKGQDVLFKKYWGGSGRVDIEETRQIGRLYIKLSNEDFCYNHDDDLCIACSKALVNFVSSKES